VQPQLIVIVLIFSSRHIAGHHSSQCNASQVDLWCFLPQKNLGQGHQHPGKNQGINFESFWIFFFNLHITGHCGTLWQQPMPCLTG